MDYIGLGKSDTAPTRLLSMKSASMVNETLTVRKSLLRRYAGDTFRIITCRYLMSWMLFRCRRAEWTRELSDAVSVLIPFMS